MKLTVPTTANSEWHIWQGRRPPTDREGAQSARSSPSAIHVDGRQATRGISGSDKKRDSVIRFAAGAPEEAYSAVWNLVTNRNDVYLFARQARRWIKTSLHASGIWRLAWTEESQILETGSNDRVVRRWRRPSEFRAGWTQAVSVVVPWTPIGRHFPAVDVPAGKPVQWVPAPAPGHKVIFAVLFAAESVAESSWPSVREPGDRNLGRFSLQNGESVWVAVRRAPLEPFEKAEAEKLANELRIHIRLDSSPEDIRGANVMVFSESRDGLPVIMDVYLGPGNVAQS